MSTATAFVTLGSLPFCPEEISGSLSGSPAYLGNLTLTQVMAFAWNLETIEFTTEGSITDGGSPAVTVSSACTLSIAPFSSSVLTTIELDKSMWFGAAISPTAIASAPSVRTPVQRVCDAASTPTGCLLDQTATATAKTVVVRFWIGTDPSNSGKYRIYYYFAFTFTETTLNTYEIRYSHASLAGFTSWGSGTISIGGHSFNWYSAYTTAASVLSGTGTLTATSSSFTY